MTALPTAPQLARYDAALQRYEAWLRDRQNPDGSFAGEDISCGAYMPMPLYGHAAGRADLAEHAWRFLEARHMRDGRLIQPEARRDMMPYTPAWLVMGAALTGNVRLRSLLRRQLLSFQDPASGGFFGSVSARDARGGVIEFDSTTQACAALCIAGDETAAVKCGQFLRDLLRAQPDPSRRLFLQWDTAGGLMREFDPGAATAHVLVYADPGQHLYKIGLLARALALLSAMTGDASYLELAESHYRRALADSPDLWTNTLAHKMAWAARTLFELTGRRSYAEDACRVADHLVSLQQSDGGFHYPELWSSYAEVPLDSKLNLSAQFATWIAYARASAATAGA